MSLRVVLWGASINNNRSAQKEVQALLSGVLPALRLIGSTLR